MRNWIGYAGKAKERRTTSLSQPSWPCIPKLPHLLRGTKDFKKFFQPKVISIGPYHHGKPRLHSMEKIKPLVAQEFLVASQHHIEDVYKKIKSNIGAGRKRAKKKKERSKEKEMVRGRKRRNKRKKEKKKVRGAEKRRRDPDERGGEEKKEEGEREKGERKEEEVGRAKKRGGRVEKKSKR